MFRPTDNLGSTSDLMSGSFSFKNWIYCRKSKIEYQNLHFWRVLSTSTLETLKAQKAQASYAGWKVSTLVVMQQMYTWA